jgi:hypothetical protein
MSVPLRSPLAYWVPFPEGDGGLVYERGMASSRIHSLIRQDGKWASFQTDVPFEVFFACGSREDDTVVAVGSNGAFFLNRFSSRTDATLIESDLRHVGECYVTSAGVVLAERSNSTRDGTVTRLRFVGWSGAQTWAYDGDESLSVAATLTSSDVFISGGENVVRITPTGTVESLSGDIAGVGYNRAGEAVRIGRDGRVSR